MRLAIGLLSQGAGPASLGERQPFLSGPPARPTSPALDAPNPLPRNAKGSGVDSLPSFLVNPPNINPWFYVWAEFSRPWGVYIWAGCIGVVFGGGYLGGVKFPTRLYRRLYRHVYTDTSHSDTPHGHETPCGACVGLRRCHRWWWALLLVLTSPTDATTWRLRLMPFGDSLTQGEPAV